MAFARIPATFFLMTVAGLTLSACGEPQQLSQTGTAAQAFLTCNAESYNYLVGEPITVVDTLNTGLRTRVLAADSFVPKDYDANRLTFTTSSEDTVSRVFCG